MFLLNVRVLEESNSSRQRSNTMIRGGGLICTVYSILLLFILTFALPAQSQWSVPSNLGPSVNTQYSELHLAISSDELTLFFASSRPGGFGGDDLWVAQRPAQNSDWG